MDEDEKKEIGNELGLSKDEVKDIDEDKLILMKDHDIDEDTADKVQELMDEGFDEDDAVEFADEL